MYEMRLDWKEFNLDMNAVEAWLRANAGDGYKGNSADTCLHLWFDEEPSQSVLDAVSAHWDNMTEESEEATAYKSQNQLDSDKASKKASAKAKLLALGLSEDEVAALVG